MERFNCTQGEQDWHDLRAKYYKTASRTPIVMGCSPFSNFEKLAQEIKFGIKPFYNNAMRLGNELEPMVRGLANEHFNDVFEPSVGLNGGFLASLDGINLDGDTIIEIKVSETTYNDILKGKMPKHYKAQMLHQLYVFEAQKAYLVAYSPKNNAIAVSDPVFDDANWFFGMVNDWERFDAFMETYQLPDEVVREDTEWEIVALKLKEISDRKKELEAEEAEYKEALLAMSNGLKCRGFGVSVYPTTRKSVDYKALIAENHISVEPYQKESTSWSVRVS